MGYNISTIENLPMLSGYYFLLVGMEESNSKTCRTLYTRFDEIAQRVGAKSAIVKSFVPEKVNDELLSAFINAPWFRNVYNDLLFREPALIIMKPHPMKFEFNDDELFALIPFATLDRVYLNENDLVKDIVALSVDGATNLIDRVMQCSKKAGFIKRLGNAIMLQPNFSGIGIDLKTLYSTDGKCDFFIHGIK